jgi:cyanobactin maturation PatA/PatG family protease
MQPLIVQLEQFAVREAPIISVPGELGQGDSRVRIAVLDGPVDISHPCLQGAKLTQLQTLVNPTSFYSRAATHGTHVASIIFGQPGGAVLGIAPNCTGLLVPIFSGEAPDGGLACSQLDLARAILLAAENGAQVINISGGQLTPSGEPEPILSQAIASCLKRNVLIVAAAGNDGCECLHIPAAAPSVLVVGAMDQDGNPIMSSNWGEAYRTQGILAPGMDVLGAVPGGTARKSGTSFAAPFVSGLIGLLLSWQIKRGQPPDPHAIRSALLNSATPCLPETIAADCRRFLAGQLNIQAVVEQLTGGDHRMTDLKAVLPSEPFIPAQDDALRQTSNQMEPAVTASGTKENRADRLSGDIPVDVISASNRGSRAQSPFRTAEGPAMRGAGLVTLSDCGCGGAPDCACGGGIQKPPLVYALGKLDYDFGSLARRDSLTQAMQTHDNPNPNPLIPDQLLDYLDQHPYDAPSIIWTLNLDATPIYAIQPAGPFAVSAYERLRQFLHSQFHQGVELVSIPGIISGSVRLQSGMVVPTVIPAVRGMYSWATKPLVEHVLGERPTDEAATTTYDSLASGLGDFLNQIYFDMRNLGLTAEDRALNYSATNAVQIAEVIRSATHEQLDFGVPVVKKSPVCRPDSDCYDVELPFFDPRDTNVANRIYRFTVDVSDIIPVSIGKMRSWTRRP